ncbi:MAG: histone deacetylase [Arenicellales bacterium]|nr:histone deacetylase [Arenicellales bacterium]
MTILGKALLLFAWGFVMTTHADSVKTGLVFHPDYLLHDTGAGHPERPERLAAIMEYLKQQGVFDLVTLIDPQPAEDMWLHQVHPEEYLKYLEESATKAPFALDPDTTLSEQSYRVAKLATGGVLTAVDEVMAGRITNAFVALRPPGHHALAERAMGFCLINHVAVAARYVQKKYGLKRVLIVDWDVHHGNGTQDIFYSDPTVFYFSTHQWPYYPGTGAADDTGSDDGVGTTLNVPLAAGAGDADVVQAFQHKLVPAAENFRPDFVFISAGFDAHEDDPLAHLQLTESGYEELTRIVKDIAARFADGRLVSLLEGGYSLSALSRSVETHLKTLSSQPIEDERTN